MSRKRSKRSPILPILILCAAVAIWIYDAYGQGKLRSFFNPENSKPVPADTRTSSEKSTGPERIGRYDVYYGCTLTKDRSNDGDSFRVLFPDGKKEIVRLYFVDTPESDFKTYGGGENNHCRIDQQADAMGRITPEQAVGIGKKAKEFNLTHLSKAPFTVQTEWDSPFNDRRYHAFIQLSYNEKTRYLHELLVEKGYARIHTKGAPMPDGTSERKHEAHLLSLQKTAKSTKAGAWGL